MIHDYGYEINGRRIWMIDLNLHNWQNDYYYENGKWNRY